MDQLCDFKNRLKSALQIRDMKAVELSEKTGISKSAISQYISGISKPKQDRIHLISKALNVNPIWLMGYNVSMDIKKNELLTLPQLATLTIKLRDDINAQELLNIYYDKLTPKNQKLLIDLAKGLSNQQ